MHRSEGTCRRNSHRHPGVRQTRTFRPESRFPTEPSETKSSARRASPGRYAIPSPDRREGRRTDAPPNCSPVRFPRRSRMEPGNSLEQPAHRRLAGDEPDSVPRRLGESRREVLRRTGVESDCGPRQATGGATASGVSPGDATRPGRGRRPGLTRRTSPRPSRRRCRRRRRRRLHAPRPGGRRRQRRFLRLRS